MRGFAAAARHSLVPSRRSRRCSAHCRQRSRRPADVRQRRSAEHALDATRFRRPARCPNIPRPQLRRPDWQSLNGRWQYQRAGGSRARPTISSQAGPDDPRSVSRRVGVVRHRAHGHGGVVPPLASASRRPGARVASGSTSARSAGQHAMYCQRASGRNPPRRLRRLLVRCHRRAAPTRDERARGRLQRSVRRGRGTGRQAGRRRAGGHPSHALERHLADRLARARGAPRMSPRSKSYRTISTQPGDRLGRASPGASAARLEASVRRSAGSRS